MQLSEICLTLDIFNKISYKIFFNGEIQLDEAMLKPDEDYVIELRQDFQLETYRNGLNYQ